ncbi:MAG: hypothetical protein A2825_00010 [Candidatus Taylorbacteria bacterium RIFCSPHIGHO2_01_FULL_43_120]|nr:MAG: hypothetical protein A2825_00010 [Candidatus Taylorbacteria bacterium RIFCSPHIGHO2_01_FULL_43_120]OHA23522.1 MAG: hypothetical protein A3B98_02165 [Candidatus Taylorbacteria bacterium RIFCSPHIGHO2_02_FULL_43_55]OHA31669.1 MAG: hypothetical protein A3B09_03745 [Candidatus Taylorbacteria bacterium RIFCSPLOWO2_01_FULL_43_83]
MSDVFYGLYNKLNSEQRKAVREIEGPVMVIAGPGTGKTTILTLRIANILRQTDTPPDGILALTFTDAGVTAIKKKLREIIGSPADSVRVHTFHSFAVSIIKEFPEYFSFASGASLVNEIEVEMLVARILENPKYKNLRPFGRPEQYISPVINAVSVCKKEAIRPSDVKIFIKEEIDGIKVDESSYSTRGKTKGGLKAEALKKIEKCEKTLLFADVFSDYETLKKEMDKYDYDDIIQEFTESLKNTELLLRLVQEKFLYVLIDEHQDTNDSQNGIIMSIADFFDSPNIFIVGDEKQAIYRFQGASVENFLKFEKVWRDMKIIRLGDNYRSHQLILDAAFSMIENNYEPGQFENLRVRLKSATKNETRPVRIVTARAEHAAESYLANEVSKISKEYPQGKIAVVVRTNKDLDKIARLFSMSKIPYAAERSVDVMGAPLGSLFLDTLAAIADTGKPELLARSVAGGAWDVSFGERVSIIKDMRAGRYEAASRRITGFEEAARTAKTAEPIQFLYLLAQLTKMEEMFSRSPESVEIWRGIISLAEKIQKEGNGAGSVFSMSEKISAYRNSKRGVNVKVWSGTNESSVRVMTAHASKGLEFDFVFIPYASEESWLKSARREFFILPKMDDNGDDIKDARRLFYVALTRAKSHVEIICSEKDRGGDVLMPLRFISELDPSCVEYGLAPEQDSTTGIFPLTHGLERGERDTGTVEYAKHVLTDSGLSVTALNHYIECPRKFLYKSILKLPEPPSAPAEKGTALHEAISALWRFAGRKEFSEVQIQDILLRVAKKYLEEKSFLSKHERDAVIKEIEDEAPKISKHLMPHFRTADQVFAENWYESAFHTEHAGSRIGITIHGKLDAVISGSGGVAVYDYKSRGAMSEAEIRGETKNSDGSYFRQLVFYRLLLENDPRFSGKVRTFFLYFIKPDKHGHCKEMAISSVNEDIANIIEEIRKLVVGVWNGDFLSNGCNRNDCQWCRLMVDTT